MFFFILCLQHKSVPLTKLRIFHVRCYLLWFCWYDIILLHVQELARVLQERGEPVLAIHISWISRHCVLLFEQLLCLLFHNAVKSGSTCITVHFYVEHPVYTNLLPLWRCLSCSWLFILHTWLPCLISVA